MATEQIPIFLERSLNMGLVTVSLGHLTLSVSCRTNANSSEILIVEYWLVTWSVLVRYWLISLVRS